MSASVEVCKLTIVPGVNSSEEFWTLVGCQIAGHPGVDMEVCLRTLLRVISNLTKSLQRKSRRSNARSYNLPLFFYHYLSPRYTHGKVGVNRIICAWYSETLISYMKMTP